MSAKRVQAEVALVTGAASGIGWAVTQALAEAGTPVVMCDCDEGRLRERRDELSKNQGVVWSLPCDVADAAAVKALVSAVERGCGPVSQLALCAGVFRKGALCSLSAEQWRQCMDSNAVGVFNLLQAVGPVMVRRGRGSIVTVASNAARTPRSGMAAYAASKAAAVALSRCAGLELAKHSIRCNIVSPGSTDTPMQRALWQDEHGAQRVIAGAPELFRLGIPLGRIATPADIADAVCFLLSDKARHITMQELTIDGGATF